MRIAHQMGLALLAAGALLVPTTAAQAAPPLTSTSATTAAVAAAPAGANLMRAPSPSCLVASDRTSANQLHVRNRCSTSQRFKIVIAFGPDTRCHTLAAGRSATYAYTSQLGARFDRLERC